MKNKFFWIVTAFLFLVFAAEDWAFYRPGSKKLDRLDQAIGRSQSDILRSRLTANQLQAIKEMVSHNMAQGEPDPAGQNYVSESLEKLTTLLKKQNIDLLSCDPRDVRQEKLYAVTPFEMELQGSYHQFGRLFEAIERSSDFIVIRQFKLSTAEKKMTAQLSVDVYLLKRDRPA